MKGGGGKGSPKILGSLRGGGVIENMPIGV